MKLVKGFHYVKTLRGSVVHVIRATTDPFSPTLCRFDCKHGFVGANDAKEPTCKACKKTALFRGVLLPLLIVLLSACGRIGVGEEFRVHVEAFESVLQAHNVDATTQGIGVQFADDLPTGVSARCYHGVLFRSPHVLVSRDKWDSSDDSYRRALIFHELGHCALSREHAEPGVRSIMSESVYSVIADYELHRDEFEQELVKDAPRKGTP